MRLEVHRYSDTSELGYFTIIGIADIYEARTSTAEVLQNELDTKEEALGRGKQEAAACRDALLSSLETIRQHVRDWKVQKSDNERYTVTGFGLGYLDSKLTSGQWIFHAGTEQTTPVDKEGISLVNFLIAN